MVNRHRNSQKRFYIKDAVYFITTTTLQRYPSPVSVRYTDFKNRIAVSDARIMNFVAVFSKFWD